MGTRPPGRTVDMNLFAVGCSNTRVSEHPFIDQQKVDAAIMVSGNCFANLYFPSCGIWDAPLECGEIEEQHSAALQAIRRRE